MAETTFKKDETNQRYLITREFIGDPDLVFKAWTDHRIIDQWWAPLPWKTKTKSCDFREGGKWLYSMSNSEKKGEPMWASMEFKTIIPGKNYIGVDYFCNEKGEDPKAKTTWSVSFLPVNDGSSTKVEIEQTFETKKDFDEAGAKECEEGFKGAYSLLDKLLTIYTKPTFIKDEEKKKIFITREFLGTNEQLWYAWTHHKLLDQWWAPKPWKTNTKSQEFRENGSWLYSMCGPENSGLHYSQANYSNIIPFKSFEAEDYFCDEKGNKDLDFPFGKQWKVNFVSHENKKIKIEMELTFPTLESLQKHLALGFREGFASALSNLDDLLSDRFVDVITNTLFIKDREKKYFSVSKNFSTSPETIWPYWTDYKLLEKWWAPDPYKTITQQQNFENGGSWRYYMLGPKGDKHYCRTEYTAITLNKNWIGYDMFCDEKYENPRMKTEQSTTFTPLEDGKKTKVDMESTFSTNEDLQQLINMDCYEGFASAQGQLDVLLEKDKEGIPNGNGKKGIKRKETSSSGEDGGKKKGKTE